MSDYKKKSSDFIIETFNNNGPLSFKKDLSEKEYVYNFYASYGS